MLKVLSALKRQNQISPAFLIPSRISMNEIIHKGEIYFFNENYERSSITSIYMFASKGKRLCL